MRLRDLLVRHIAIVRYYPMIRNYLGFPRGISGGALATRAFQQSTMFGAGIIFATRVVGLATEGPHHVILAGDGRQVTARTVVIATGARYCRLGIPVVEGLTGRGVFYGAGGSEAQAMRGRGVFVVGAGNSTALFILIGAEPHTSWLPATIERDGRGYILVGWTGAGHCCTVQSTGGSVCAWR